MLAGVPTDLSMSGAIEALTLWIQTRDLVLELLSTSIKEAIYEQHRVHRRLGCHCYRRLVIFWFALGNPVFALGRIFDRSSCDRR